MKCIAYTDGASRGNPGDSGIGIVVRNAAGEVVLTTYGFIGTATNNIAEYTALLALLKRIKTTPCSQLVVHSDSELMVDRKSTRLNSSHSRASRMPSSA